MFFTSFGGFVSAQDHALSSHYQLGVSQLSTTKNSNIVKTYVHHAIIIITLQVFTILMGRYTCKGINLRKIKKKKNKYLTLALLVQI